jgi:aminoglycoside phosphotransferase (APT) family kinase protein
MPTTPLVPSGKTARRLEWQFLPRNVRDLVERRCGSPVVSAASQGGGFTPGFASVLTCQDGSRHFVKAASVRAQKAFADSYREEARKLAALPDSIPAARLRWSLDDDWVVLGLEYVEGRAPRRPWRPAELERCLAAVERMSRDLTPVPSGLMLDSFTDDFAGFVGAWEHVAATRPDLPHRREAAELAGRFAEAAAGDTVVHTDLRDDNLILGADGRVWMCDWNWPVRGAAWLDTLFLLLQPRGDGVDVDSVLAHSELTREVPDEAIDSMLALLCGYFFQRGDEPVPPTSPYLRQHQQWFAEVTWDWLAERRGWS